MRGILTFSVAFLFFCRSLFGSDFGATLPILAKILVEEQLNNNLLNEKVSPEIAKGVAIARKVYETSMKLYQNSEKLNEMMKVAKSFKPEELLSMAEKEFCRNSEGLCDIDIAQEIKRIGKITDISRFNFYKSKLKGMDDSFLKSLVNGSAASKLLPQMAGISSKFFTKNGVMDFAESVIQKSLAGTGLSESLRLENFQTGIVNRAVNDFMQEAKKSGNVLAKAEVVNQMLDHRRNAFMKGVDERDRARFIREEMERDLKKEKRKNFMKQYRKSIEKKGTRIF